jgi:hypothetical protein
VNDLAFRLAGLLLRLEGLAVAGILAALLAFGARQVGLPILERERRPLALFGRGLAAVLFLVTAAFYALFAGRLVSWTVPTILTVAGVATVVLAPTLVRRLLGRAAPRLGMTGALGQSTLLLALLLAAAVTLMRAGYLALTEDRVLLLVDVTGETGVEGVRWAPPGAPLREERLTTHHVVFRTAEGRPMAEAWLYGDQVAVKGRVLRVGTLLAAAGVPNLFELTFAHNGYASPERHASQPHLAVSLPPLGPLAVHPWWRPVQARLLARWEAGIPDSSPWGIRAVTTESTYFPLVDAAGRPAKGVYRLTLTPGGLSSS